ncbi:MAG: hypothetical protein AB1714_01320 [Acidobacteriota bacterium]
MRANYLKTGLALLPLASYPFWSRLLFYSTFGWTLALSAVALIVLWRDRLPFDRLGAVRDRNAAAALAILSYAIYTAASLGLFGETREFTGDEPNYLMATASIIRDGDIRLKNNFARRDYLDFYPGKLFQRTTRGRDAAGYPVHGVAVSVWLVPFYYMGSILGGGTKLVAAIRLGMAIVAATLAAALFLLLRTLSVDRRLALGVASLTALSPPILNYAGLVYPETGVALLFAVFLLFMFSTPTRWAVCSATASLLPWFGVKFNAMMLGMMLALVGQAVWDCRRLRAWRRGARAIGAVVLAATPSLLAYEMFLWVFYGSFSPAAAAGGRAVAAKESPVENIVRYFSHDTLEKLRYMPQTLLADLVDQKGGVLFYSPALVIALLGAVAMARATERRRYVVVLLPAALHLGLYSYTNYMGGFCPPGRPVLPLLPLASLPLAAGLVDWRNVYTRTLLLLSTGVLACATLAAAPLFYHNLIYTESREVSNLAFYFDTPFFKLSDYLPVLTTAGVVEWRNTAIVLVCLAALLLTARRGSTAGATGGLSLAAFATVFAWLVWTAAWPKVYQTARLGSVEIQLLDGADAYVEPGGLWLRGSVSGRAWMVPSASMTEIVLRVQDRGGLVITCDGREFFPDSSGILTLPLHMDQGDRASAFEIVYKIPDGFRPSDRDPASRDRRWLGAFLSAGAETP